MRTQLFLAIFFGILVVVVGVFTYIEYELAYNADPATQQIAAGEGRERPEREVPREEADTASSSLPAGEIRAVELSGECVDVEVARTPEERAQGLSGRDELADGEGMLFVFNRPSRHSFWMKEMNFSIDIIWFSSEQRVVYTHENAYPESYPESFRPDEAAVYVLEVPAGFADEYEVEEGDTMSFRDQNCG